jgi:hypothetical protein
MQTFMQNAKELLLDLASGCAKLAQKGLQRMQHFVDQQKQRRGK